MLVFINTVAILPVVRALESVTLKNPNLDSFFLHMKNWMQNKGNHVYRQDVSGNVIASDG